MRHVGELFKIVMCFRNLKTTAMRELVSGIRHARISALETSVRVFLFEIMKHVEVGTGVAREKLQKLRAVLRGLR
jgi:hypothetical protein